MAEYLIYLYERFCSAKSAIVGEVRNPHFYAFQVGQEVGFGVRECLQRQVRAHIVRGTGNQRYDHSPEPILCLAQSEKVGTPKPETSLS